MKQLLVTFATLVGIAIMCAISVGWLLAHPVQTRIGNPPTDLAAQPVTSCLLISRQPAKPKAITSRLGGKKVAMCLLR